MATATPAEPTQEPHAASGHDAHPAPIDPTAEIDSKKTLWVLVVSTIFVFGSVWALSVVFQVTTAIQREGRVGESGTPMLDDVRAFESEMLQAGDEPKRKSIEESMRELEAK